MAKCAMCGRELPELGTPIEKLVLSNRAQNTLRRNGIEYIEQIFEHKDIMRLRNMGKKTYEEISNKIKAFAK